MSTIWQLFRNKYVAAGAALVVLVIIAFVFAFEPVTRQFVAQDDACAYCHLVREYDARARMSMTRIHPPLARKSEIEAKCVNCHLPDGFFASIFLYAHYASITDLFGHFRDRESERAGEWIPFSAARAYRVRDRLFESDSVTCRSCHIESEIKPKKARGKNAHELALKERNTCIECHYNLVHRTVELRETAFKKTENADSKSDGESP